MNKPQVIQVPDKTPAKDKQQAHCPDCGNDYERLSLAPKPERITERCESCREKIDAEENAESRRQRREIAKEQLMAALTIPDEYQTATFESFKPWADPPDRGLQHLARQRAWQWVELWPKVHLAEVWRGGVGTGKSHLLYSIARLLITDHLMSCRVVKLDDLSREIRASWSDKNAKPESAVLRYYRRLDWLAIDEASRHALKRDPTQDLYSVVAERLEWKRPTIIVTNEVPAMLKSLIGEALVSRLNRAGGVVDFGNSDFRSRSDV